MGLTGLSIRRLLSKSVVKMRLLLVFIALILFTGCSTRTSKSSSTYKTNFSSKSNKEQINYNDLDKLYPYHNKWHQTPYKFGGFGSDGIDCSAFVQRAYFDLFGMKIPRTTKQQVLAGKKVSRANIKTSDLVFFKTGYNSRHVGIYLQHGDFIHASSSKGIIISNINDPYWKKRYWMVRRYK